GAWASPRTSWPSASAISRARWSGWGPRWPASRRRAGSSTGSSRNGPKGADPRPSPTVNGKAETSTPRSGASARAAWWVGAGIFLSRVAGFVREAVFGAFFGASAVADVWSAALRTPNVIQNLLGEGTLSASFIPVYAGLLE